LASEPFNEYWSFIKPNTLFSSVPLPVFHFCAYSYILTRRGAQKLMAHLKDSETKSFTVSDHLLGHPSVGLTKYHTSPLLSYCFQENDPVYQQSQFNNLHREDTFDSDLWNNTECFGEEELAPFLPKEEPKELPKESTQTTVYYMPTDEKPLYLYEKTWLEDILQTEITFISIYSSVIVDNAWYLVQRPHLDKFITFFDALKVHNLRFKVLHVSDEYATDPIGFYEYPHCAAVVRTYLRPTPQNVITIPLGYHHKYNGPHKPWDKRDLVWSFHGTNWHNRQDQLNTLVSFVPFSCNLQPNWNHPTATKEKQYLSVMANSKFCPVMRGQNVETFRMYEALETGTLPIVFGECQYSRWIDENMQLSELYDWTNPQTMSKTITEETQLEVQKRWTAWKDRLRMILKI
jgi:hypothetical protein